jgi:CRISPR-associated protein Cas2
MLIVSYDFEKNKIRTDFSKFLKKFGSRIQYSVYEINNSPRVINNIKKEIDYNYKKRFSKTDSIIIFSTCNGCDKNAIKYGSAVNSDKEFVVFD